MSVRQVGVSAQGPEADIQQILWIGLPLLLRLRPPLRGKPKLNVRRWRWSRVPSALLVLFCWLCPPKPTQCQHRPAGRISCSEV